MTRAGIVTLAGKPNAGKSTLLNRLVGQKLGITSVKPQSTRDRVVGILTRNDQQLVLLDTPGLLDPRYPLQHAMAHTTRSALSDADVIAYLIDASAGEIVPLHVAAALQHPPRAPIITILNKCDQITPAERQRLQLENPDAICISALTGDGIEELLDALAVHIPESPFLYPEDDISTQSTRFFVSELIRETALDQLEEEVPYSLACEIEEFRETSELVYIRAVLFVERPSQKAIIIGARGSSIRQIGSVSRRKIEDLLDARVYLDLWVKVLPNWRRNVALLRRFGYHVHEDELR